MAGIIGFTRTQFDSLDQLLGDLKQRLSSVEGKISDDTVQQYVDDWLTEHGATAGYIVTDGDLTITLT